MHTFDIRKLIKIYYVLLPVIKLIDKNYEKQIIIGVQISIIKNILYILRIACIMSLIRLHEILSIMLLNALYYYSLFFSTNLEDFANNKAVLYAKNWKIKTFTV